VLVLGALGLLTGLTALALARRTRPTAQPDSTADRMAD